MDCPVCKNVNLMMSTREGIEIDYCPQCRGVWLDRGELDKIIDRSAAAGSSAAPAPASQQQAYPAQQPQQQPPYQPPPAQPYYDPRHHGGYHKKKKREGFLSDLFDFD